MRTSRDSGIEHLVEVARPALDAAPTTFLADIAAGLRAHGVQDAVARRNPGPIFDWMQRLIALQGISDAQAFAYLDAHGTATWADLADRMVRRPACPKLRSFWHYDQCGYRKAAAVCSRPDHFAACPVPRHDLRKGTLNQAAYSLALFIRDICDGDFVGWLDFRLTDALEPWSATTLAEHARTGVVEPLSGIAGTGPKLWSMIMADLLLAGDPARPHWVEAGASMVAIDTLLHNFMHRTGILRRFRAEHPYGPNCYAPNGCAALIRQLSERIDARAFNPAFPACFPRFVQHAIWRFCAADHSNVCNGNHIDDRRRCENLACAAYRTCDRVRLGR